MNIEMTTSTVIQSKQLVHVSLFSVNNLDLNPIDMSIIYFQACGFKMQLEGVRYSPAF